MRLLRAGCGSQLCRVMGLHDVILVMHSMLRWVVLAAGLVALTRALLGARSKRAWSATDTSVLRAFVGVFDVQLLLGLFMYFGTSALGVRMLAHAGVAMKSSVLRFFAVEHLAGMLTAAIVLHVGTARARRLGDAPSRQKRTAIVVGIAFANRLSSRSRGRSFPTRARCSASGEGLESWQPGVTTGGRHHSTRGHRRTSRRRAATSRRAARTTRRLSMSTSTTSRGLFARSERPARDASRGSVPGAARERRVTSSDERQGARRFSMRGKGIVSRTCGSPQIQETVRSMPRPKPACGNEP